jgi:F0F1-type ATP synthase membrane subunit c/vacuolar-type H+-ATPase subunit K
MFVTIIGPSAVIAAIGYASIKALGRNPSAASKILSAMIISLVFAESIAFVALLILFQLFGRG